VELNEKLVEVLEQLSKAEGLPKAYVIRRALALLKYIEDERAKQLKLTLADQNNNVVKEIVMSQ
jgi:predicted DNA-binding protein